MLAVPYVQSTGVAKVQQFTLVLHAHRSIVQWTWLLALLRNGIGRDEDGGENSQDCPIRDQREGN